MHDDEWRKSWRRPIIEHGVPTRWQWLVLYPEKLLLGDFVDIGAFTVIVAKNGVVIRDNVEIGSHSSIYSESSIDGRQGRVVLGKGCMIGSHTTIMPGVMIGEGAVVGAYSFVQAGTKILPYSVGWGVPYRMHKIDRGCATANRNP